MENVFEDLKPSTITMLSTINETLHPLVSVIDFSKSKPWPGQAFKTINVILAFTPFF